MDEAARTWSRWAASSGAPASTCSRRSRRTRSTCSPATFPTNNAMANLLLGAPVTFYQGLGDFEPRRARVGRRRVRAGRMARRRSRDVELRAALRAHQPVHRSRGSPERASSRARGRRCGPMRRSASCSLAIPASARGIAQSANAFMPRAGLAWDPTGTGMWSVRAQLRPLLRSVPERRGHGVAGGGQRDAVRRSSTSSAAPGSISRTRTWGARFPAAGHVRAPVDASSRSTWTPGPRRCRTGTSSVQRSLFEQVPRRGPLRRARRERTCRATSRPTRRSMGPAPRRRTPTAAACTPTVPPTAAPATSRPSRCCEHRAVALHAGQFSVSRRFGDGVGFNVSYWLSRNDRPPVGDESLAAPPPSRSPARTTWRRTRSIWTPSTGPRSSTRVTASSPARSWLPHALRRAPAAVRAMFGGWQLNGIATLQLRHALHGFGFRQRRAAGQQPADLGLPRQPPEPGRRSERRAAHRRRVDQPLGVRAAEPADAGRPVRQRRPQHRARAVLRQRRRVARARLSRSRREARLQFRAEVVQRRQPRQLRACRWPT